jgi:hypothetical protein
MHSLPSLFSPPHFVLKPIVGCTCSIFHAPGCFTSMSSFFRNLLIFFKANLFFFFFLLQKESAQVVPVLKVDKYDDAGYEEAEKRKLSMLMDTEDYDRSQRRLTTKQVISHCHVLFSFLSSAHLFAERRREMRRVEEYMRLCKGR